LKPLARAAASRLLAQLRGRRVLVAGDVMLDEFLWGSVSRISPEAPVPVVKVTRQSFHLGGAGNVACNVRALGGHAVVVGVIGGDAAGERIRAGLATAGVEDGERVRIVSGYGAAELPARVSARILPGQLFATFHSPAVFLNSVTGPHRDSVAGTPEYKVTAVRRRAHRSGARDEPDGYRDELRTNPIDRSTGL